MPIKQRHEPRSIVRERWAITSRDVHTGELILEALADTEAEAKEQWNPFEGSDAKDFQCQRVRVSIRTLEDGEEA